MGKIAKVTAAGLKHGDYEGNEMQLPAYFVMGQDCILCVAHYSTSAGDVPSPEELAEILR